MNKKFRYLLPLFVLLASCNTPSTSESTSEVTQGPTVESVLQIINSSLDCTELRDEIRIEKDGVTYCVIFTRLRYDQKNEFFYSYYQENSYAGLDSSSPTKNINNEVYYDGEYSYSLDTDDMYLKVEEEFDVKPIHCDFDFTKIEELNLEVSGVYQTLTGVIKSENACEFLNVTGKEIGDISYTSICNETNLQSIKLSYTQNGFNVTRSIEYSYLSINLELPISIYIKTE